MLSNMKLAIGLDPHAAINANSNTNTGGRTLGQESAGGGSARFKTRRTGYTDAASDDDAYSNQAGTYLDRPRHEYRMRDLHDDATTVGLPSRSGLELGSDEGIWLEDTASGLDSSWSGIDEVPIDQLFELGYRVKCQMRRKPDGGMINVFSLCHERRDF